MTDTEPKIRQSGTVPVISHVPAWAWRCEEETCGWVGVGHASERAALKEASDHYWDEHQIAVCMGTDVGHPGHFWRHVPGTDSVEECGRCGSHCGK